MFVRNRKLIYTLFLLFLVLNNTNFSQQFQRLVNSIPVADSEGKIPNTFSGGHNNIEHQFVDLDGDEDFDIFFLDSDKTFGWFENKGDKFNPDFEYSLIEIPGLFFSDWFYFTDIDADNDYDFFTGNVDLISFYENTGTPFSPSFILVEDTVRDADGMPIFSEFGSNPVFADVDADNDFDFITGNSAGTLTFYENTGTPQQFIFKFITNVWQDIIIIGSKSSEQNRHGASAIDFIDIDADNDLDLFWGDFFSNSMYFIENQGTPQTADMQLISNVYPINEDSINTSGFNMPRFADIDNNGTYDLFASVLFDPTVKQSLMFYINNGTPQNANHHLITEDYLKTLDVGNSSAPVFIDIDGDNDMDFFSGSLSSPFGTIHFLENTGTAALPSFQYIDSSYFNIESDLSITCTFGDLDNDNDFDMIIGRFNGKLAVYWNTGSINLPEFVTSEALLNNLGSEIDIGTSASPFLIDVDGDDDLDLAIGGFNGQVSFYKNTGSQQNYEFTLEQNYFAGIDVGDNSTPFLIDYDSNGSFDLFSGSRDGKLYYFENNGNNQNPVWNLITDKFLDENFGSNSTPGFVDIDNDSDIDLVLGNVKGGFYLYNNTEISTVAKREAIKPNQFYVTAFPNPFNPGTTINLDLSEGKNITIDIYNILGEKIRTIYSGYLSAGEHRFFWSGKNNSGSILPSGSYIISAFSDKLKKTFKVSLVK